MCSCNDKEAKSENGEHISADLLENEAKGKGHLSLSEWERTAVQREQSITQIQDSTVGVSQSDNSTLAKWKNEYYEHLKTTGKSYYSEVSQKEAEDKFGNGVNAVVGVDKSKQQYLISIISYGNGTGEENTDAAIETADIVFGSPDYVKQIDERFQSKIKSPILDKLAEHGITLNNKEGFTVNVGVDGTVKLGESNIKDETKIAAIKQAIESDETLGQQLVNTCRNDSLFGFLNCI